jgi:uncharacterized protein (DUF486 family)
MKTILLLTISNIFMTFAWYGHLKYRDVPLYKVIVISWIIAFFEYCFQVPANRIGSYAFSAAQLKTIQEVITLTVFAVFSVLYLKQPLRWNHIAGFAMIVGAVEVIFKQWWALMIASRLILFSELRFVPRDKARAALRRAACDRNHSACRGPDLEGASQAKPRRS